MSDSKKLKGTEIKSKIEQKLILTSTEKLYLQVLGVFFYLLAQCYTSKKLPYVIMTTEYIEVNKTEIKDPVVNKELDDGQVYMREKWILKGSRLSRVS